MPTLTVRVDDDIYEDLARIAAAREITMSEFVRRALAEATDRPSTPDRHASETPDTLSAVNRLQLSLLHRILGRVLDGFGDDGTGVEGDREYQELRARVLEAGYVADYDDEFIAIEPELPRRESGWVMDVLDMFTHLEHSLSRLTESDRQVLDKEVSVRSLTFWGFDANYPDESRWLRYARHLIATDRWMNLAEHFDDQHERGNSHMPTTDLYRRMLAEFTPIWKDKLRAAQQDYSGGAYVLTVDELRRVARATTHPDHR